MLHTNGSDTDILAREHLGRTTSLFSMTLCCHVQMKMIVTVKSLRPKSMVSSFLSTAMFTLRYC